ncbi:MAG: hypothetical protein JNL11_18530 [Bdellovibrionaceae bacterium]|nr:hypothetical protein [Pseudobdellovibrionaceae bacterium]
MPIAILLKAIITMGLCLLLFYPLIEKFNQTHNRIYQTCQFVFERIIPVGADLSQWLRDCRMKSRYVMRETAEPKPQLERGNQILSELKVSHLELFGPQESAAILTDTDLENGIESKFMDGELIITRIFPGSEAQKKGLQSGDRVVLGKNESMGTYTLNRWRGELALERRKKIYTVKLEPKTFTLQRPIRVSEVEGVKIISVESFKSHYFDPQKLESVFAKINPGDKVIVDLRGNNGGNFVAGLRVLTPFLCQPTVVGHLKKNRDLGRVGYFDDDLDDEYQIQTLARYDSIALKTFKTKHCLPRPQMVLVDAQSKSTAEWVALAFRELFKTPIYGAGTAGELLVAIFYPLTDIWGPGVTISIPVAYYHSLAGKTIEGRGLVVDGNIYSHRSDYERGYDSEQWQAARLVNHAETDLL